MLTFFVFNILLFFFLFFFFNDTATTEIYTLSLHDALPILRRSISAPVWLCTASAMSTLVTEPNSLPSPPDRKSTPSELQSRRDLVCRLLLEKKKKKLSCHSNIKKKKKQKKNKNT